jgi:hypothetical protein
MVHSAIRATLAAVSGNIAARVPTAEPVEHCVGCRTCRSRRASRPAWLCRATGPSEQPCRRHSVLHRPPTAHRGWAPASSASLTATPPAARAHTVLLTSHRCPFSHAQETVTASCPMRSPHWAQLSLSCSSRDVQDGCLENFSRRGRGHWFEMHSIPQMFDPPGQPIHGGVPPPFVTRVDASGAERCLTGAHGTSTAHARVCHRDQCPRLPTTCREVLRERRTPARRLQERRRVWHARLASTRQARA